MVYIIYIVPTPVGIIKRIHVNRWVCGIQGNSLGKLSGRCSWLMQAEIPVDKKKLQWSQEFLQALPCQMFLGNATQNVAPNEQNKNHTIPNPRATNTSNTSYPTFLDKEIDKDLANLISNMLGWQPPGRSF